MNRPSVFSLHRLQHVNLYTVLSPYQLKGPPEFVHLTDSLKNLQRLYFPFLITTLQGRDLADITRRDNSENWKHCMCISNDHDRTVVWGLYPKTPFLISHSTKVQQRVSDLIVWSAGVNFPLTCKYAGSHFLQLNANLQGKILNLISLLWIYFILCFSASVCSEPQWEAVLITAEIVQRWDTQHTCHQLIKGPHTVSLQTTVLVYRCCIII